MLKPDRIQPVPAIKALPVHGPGIPRDRIAKKSGNAEAVLRDHLAERLMLQEANDIIRIWPDIKNIFAVAHSEAEYDRQVSFLDSLLEEVGEDEGHPLASLIETAG